MAAQAKDASVDPMRLARRREFLKIFLHFRDRERALGRDRIALHTRLAKHIQFLQSVLAEIFTHFHLIDSIV